MKLVDRLWDRFSLNPAAWFLLMLVLLTEYWNYEKGVQLDTVCEAIHIPDVLSINPKTPVEKAQAICEDRRYTDLRRD